MPIIKLTKQEFKVIDKTKTGWNNLKLVAEYPILFNTDKIIKIQGTDGEGSRISFVGATGDCMYVKEDLETIEFLINK